MIRKALIIDDDNGLCERVRAILEKNLDCHCDVAGRVVLAKNLLREQEYDIVILDRDLPDGDGLELVEQRFGLTPVSQYLVVSNWQSVPDREKGLGEGVFEYLGKPFSQVELIEKAKRLMMANGCWRGDLIKIHNRAYFAQGRGELVVDGRRQRLSQTDADLLSLLSGGGIVSCQQIREGLWHGREDMTDNAISIRISRLRAKLGNYGARLRSYYRLGYQLHLAPNMMIDTKMT